MSEVLRRLLHGSRDAERAWCAKFDPLWKSIELGAMWVTRLHSFREAFQAIAGCVAVRFVKEIPFVEISTQGLRESRFLLNGRKTW
jgi:hypothetical protein